jgi:hypothetical protein
VTPQRAALPLVAVVAAACGAALVGLLVLAGPARAGVAIAVALGFLVPVRVPWGGSVPMAVAIVIAVVALVDPVEAMSTLGVALAIGGVAHICLMPSVTALANVERFAAGIVAAIGLDALLALAVDDPPTIAGVAAAAVGMFLVDVVLSQVAARPEHRIAQRSAVPVYLTLACAGALVAVAAAEVGVAMAAVAAFPLLITRYSFERYAGAADTLQQTVQALGLVPELAGLAPLGHSERAASYAISLAHALHLDRAAVTRVETATRLHHLGAVPFEADADQLGSLSSAEISQSGAKILRDARFPQDVVDLLAQSQADSLDAVSPSIEAAIVRIASTFDEIVGDDPAATDRGVALVSGNARDPHSRRVVGSLLELVATDEDLVQSAIAAGDRFREAAVGIDLEAVSAGRTSPAELLPFTRRA